MKNIMLKISAVIAGISLMALSVFLCAYAEEAAIMQFFQYGENMRIYIKGLDEYDNVTGQIGQESVEIVGTGTEPVGHTIILVDNSLSVTRDNMSKAKEILTEYFQNKSGSEKVSLAVYGTNIQYLVEKEADSQKLISALDEIVTEDKDTYLTDVLYDELKKLDKKTEYTRFIIVTDGVDNKVLGYTKEELLEYLEKYGYPVYSFGCRYKDNDEQLKNLFAISRQTNAGYYFLEDYNEYGDITDELCKEVTYVEIKLPDDLKDGSTRNILLSFEGTNGTTEIMGEILMPFKLIDGQDDKTTEEVVAEEKTVAEETRESVETAQVSNTAVLESEGANETKENGMDMISVAAVVIIAAAVIVLIFMNISKKKNKDKNNDGRQVKHPKKQAGMLSESLPAEAKTIQTNPDATVFNGDIYDEGGTKFLNNSSEYIVVLKDMGNLNKVFKYPLINKVVVGRKYDEGVNIVLNYEETISRKHCEISMNNGRFYIKDLNSSNKTLLNGEEVRGSAEFKSGDIIQLGKLKMMIEIAKI